MNYRLTLRSFRIGYVPDECYRACHSCLPIFPHQLSLYHNSYRSFHSSGVMTLNSTHKLIHSRFGRCGKGLRYCLTRLYFVFPINILFHYRNHGSAHGRVLAGIQVPDADLDRFYASLARLGYPYKEQSDNPAYHLFLK